MTRWITTACVMFGHHWRKRSNWFGIPVVRCTACDTRLPRRFWGRVGL